jgi:hypothetical protein
MSKENARVSQAERRQGRIKEKTHSSHVEQQGVWVQVRRVQRAKARTMLIRHSVVLVPDE